MQHEKRIKGLVSKEEGNCGAKTHTYIDRSDEGQTLEVAALSSSHGGNLTVNPFNITNYRLIR